MRTEVNISNDMLIWAINRSGYELPEISEKVPNLIKWLNGEKKPTFKQLEVFSQKVYLPFGYLFLSEPPKEKLPIPFFRTNNSKEEKVSINVYDTILLLQQRQDWLSNYLKENDFKKLPFVGKYNNKNSVNDIVTDIRKKLGLFENWANQFQTWTGALNHLIEIIEDKGIITVFNGIVGNNTHRKIQVDECRGFVLTDEYSPFMFINNADGKATQMFTVAHELAHIWIGKSAGFDFRKLQPADDPIEKLCDSIAAELLVPKIELNKFWKKQKTINKAAKYFKVSEIVIARRLLDTGEISKSHFFEFYDEYSNREFVKKQNQNPGGDFYATALKRLSRTYSSHINNALNSGQLLFLDACKLTGLKGDTFQKFFAEHVN